MSKIRVKLKKIRPILKKMIMLAKVFKASHFDVNCLDSMIDGAENRHNPMIIRFGSYGDSNKECNVIIIGFNRNWIKTAGLFALLNKTICGLYFADRYNLVPVVDNWPGCPYDDGEKDEGSDSNVFEYYFEPVSTVTIEEANSSWNVAHITDANMDLVLEDCCADWFTYSDVYIEKMSEIFSKYISFNERTKNRLDADYNKIVNENEKVLGVHFRGTDYKLNMNGHPVSLEPHDFFKAIDEALSTKQFDKIFLATDDSDALIQFREKYGSMITYYPDVHRVTGLVSTAFASKDKASGKEIGYGAIRDSYSLSKCDGLVAGLSQVSIFAAICKRSTKDSFKFFTVIDKGVNNNTKEWMDEFEYNVKS